MRDLIVCKLFKNNEVSVSREVIWKLKFIDTQKWISINIACTCVCSQCMYRETKKDARQVDSTTWTSILNHPDNGLGCQVTGVVIEVIVH